MRKKLNVTDAIFPMPVLMIATYNEDGSVNVMNAAWGTMLDSDKVALNLSTLRRQIISALFRETTIRKNLRTADLRLPVPKQLTHRSSTNFPFVWNVNLSNFRAVKTVSA